MKQINELMELAQRIAAHAEQEGISLARMVRQYPALGSERTWRDLREGQVDGYDVGTWLNNYRSAWATIEEIGGADGAEPIFDDLQSVVQLRRAFLETTKNAGINRVVIVQGASGTGKTTALRMLTGKYGTRVLAVEASDAWGDKPSALLGAILRALGKSADGLPASTVRRLEMCQDALGVTRRCVAVDEAHHLGPHCLNTIKTLVNTTPGEWVLLAIPTLWAKLETRSYLEARQISTNRLAERLRLELRERDIERFLARGLEAEGSGELKQAAKVIRAQAQGNGNFSFVRDVVGLLRRTGATGKTLTAQAAAEAVASVAGRR